MQRDLQLGSYETAWMLLHKLRRSLVESPERFERLTGRIELDDAYVGGVERGTRGRGTTSKAKILVAVEVAGTGCGRTVLTVVEAMTAPALESATLAAVTPGATITTDGHASYDGLGALGYRHDRKVEGTPAKAGILFPRVHRVISNLKRWLLCTHAGRVTKKHLQRYLNEFQYRFNRRGRTVDIFRRLIQRLTFQGPLTYTELVGTQRADRSPDRDLKASQEQPKEQVEDCPEQ
jgi:transposase-like protein